MDCACHGQAAYWHRDARKASGGYWRCAVKQRAHNAARDRKHPEAKRRRQSVYWHRADGGYVKRRRLHLEAQRQRIMQELQQLEQEAARC